MDVGHIALTPIQIERFDRELDRLGHSAATELHMGWKSRYGFFYQDYIERMLRIGQVKEDGRIPPILSEIAAGEDFSKINAAVKDVFGDMEQQETELTDAFKRLRYYHPSAPVPDRIIAFFSGFSVQITVGEDYIGIGLDLFLGGDSPFYPGLRGTFPRYISRHFSPENIVPRVVEAHLRENVVSQNHDATSLLDYMIYHGKVLYMMDLMIPLVEDSLKINYTDRQMAWARHYETDIWNWLVEKQLLYTTDILLIQKHTGEAPFTAELGERNESAPKLGVFLGWMIVRKYMEQHPETSAEALLTLKNSQAILEGARYRGH